MSDCRNPDSRWPPVEIMCRAKEIDDTGLIPFVDTEAAARYLALAATRSNAIAHLVAARPSISSASLCAMPSRTYKPGRLSGGIITQQARTRVSTSRSKTPGLNVRRGELL